MLASTFYVPEQSKDTGMGGLPDNWAADCSGVADQRVNESAIAVGGRQSVVWGGYDITPHVSRLTFIGLQAVRR